MVVWLLGALVLFVLAGAELVEELAGAMVLLLDFSLFALLLLLVSLVAAVLPAVEAADVSLLDLADLDFLVLLVSLVPWFSVLLAAGAEDASLD